MKKAVQIANGIYNNKIGVETELVPSIYVLDDDETFMRYLNFNFTITALVLYNKDRIGRREKIWKSMKGLLIC